MIDRVVRIVLQARTMSARLPAKVLLPVGGMPLAILCAKRLGSTGHEVVLATSDTLPDDLLALTAKNEGIKVFRGPLDDVRARYLACIADLDDSALVVRATADNPVPDGSFVDELIALRERSCVPYLGTMSPEDGLPYGLSAEVFTAGALRRSAEGDCDAFAREHVTVRLRELSGAGGAVMRGAFLPQDCSSLRVTIDTLDDYLRVAGIFRQLACPEAESWRRIVYRAMYPSSHQQRAPWAVLMLGTVQLGMNYGIANQVGRPSDAQARELLCVALEGGVEHIDTARAYGDAERRLGGILPKAQLERLFIVSKLLPLTDVPDDAPEHEVQNAVDASVFGSCHALKRDRIDVVMFHRGADRLRWQRAALARLCWHRDEERIGAIGVSVYNPEEAIDCLGDLQIKHLQIPFNLLDSRWLRPPFQSALAARPDVRVHVRSVFLQGLLLGGAKSWPVCFQDPPGLLLRIDQLVRECGRGGRADLCLAYVRAFPWVSSVVVGVDTSAQLEELLLMQRTAPLSTAQADRVCSCFPDIPDQLINPAKWNEI